MAATPQPSAAAEVPDGLPDFDITRYGAAVFDLDGTVWLSGDPIPGAIDFLESLRAQGTIVAFATNISLSSLDDVRDELLACGLAKPGEHVVTAGSAVALTVARAGITDVAALCSPPLKAGLAAQGVRVVDVREVDRGDWREPREGHAIVMAGWPDCTLRDIETIGQLAAWGNPTFISSLDPGFPGKHGYEPGAGMMVAAARALHSFEATICGKPSAGYATAVLEGVPTDRPIVMFGDSQRADTGLARLMGADSVLILEPGKRPVADLPQPTFVARSVADPSPQRWNS
jgi:glycerol-1-phosphatase